MTRKGLRYFFLIILLVLFIDGTSANSWLFGTDKGMTRPLLYVAKMTLLFRRFLVYNAWHKTELERWLDDHDIPYPAAADRKDLTDRIAQNWDKASTEVYKAWEYNRLREWLQERAIAFDPKANTQVLLDKVKANWYDRKAEAESSWETVKEWIFDS